MNANSQTRNRQDLFAVFALLLLSSLAFIRLLALPAFEDEGTELRWIWRAIEAGEWLQPLSDGKPLQVWLMVPWIRLGFHPLTVIRTMNVFGGMIGVVLVYRLALHLFGDRRSAFVSGALFAICPFAVYLQRLAVSETFLSTAGIWALLCVVKFVKSPTPRHAVLLSVSLVLAAFAKFPVGFNFVLSLPLALTMMPTVQRQTPRRRPLLINSIRALLPVVVLAIAVLVVAFVQLRRGQLPGFGLKLLLGIGAGGYQDIAAQIGIPPMNLLDELAAQLSWPVVAIGLIGILVGAIRGDWRLRWLIAVGLIPLLAIGLLAEFWYPRYLLFPLPPLVIAATWGWTNLSVRVALVRTIADATALTICVGFMGRQSALLMIEPLAANWSPLDRVQYIEGWSSGYGYPEAAAFLLQSRAASATTYALDGHSAYQLLAYLPADWKQRVRTINYASGGISLRTEAGRLDNLLSSTPAWIVVSQQLLQPYLESSFGRANLDRIDVRRIAEFKKPGSRAQLDVYEVTQR